MFIRYSKHHDIHQVSILESFWRKNICECLEQHVRVIQTILLRKLPRDCVQMVIDHVWKSDFEKFKPVSHVKPIHTFDDDTIEYMVRI